MGCLIELFLEIFVEGLLEWIAQCYLKLVLLILPERRISELTRRIVKTVAVIVMFCLFLVLLIGLSLLVQQDPDIQQIGSNMIRISLFVMAGQILFGILAWIIRCCKKQK